MNNIIRAEQFDEVTIANAFKDLREAIEFLPAVKWRQLVKELDMSIVESEFEE